MVLITTGTNEQAFDRLVSAAAGLAEREDAFVQYGSSRLPHGKGVWVDFVDFDELAERMREARVVVCHAGVGSIMLARRCGHRPIVMPRRVDLGEAVDDHQLHLARRLDRAGIVVLAENEQELLAAVEASVAEPSADAPGALAGAAELAADVRDYLSTLVQPQSR